MARISFSVGAKDTPSDLTSTTANPLEKYPHLKQGFFADNSAANYKVKAASNTTHKSPVLALTPSDSPAKQSQVSIPKTYTPQNTARDQSEHPSPHFNLQKKHNLDMAEPPPKRAKRTDSAAMWERTSKPTDTRDKPRGHPGDTKPKEGRDRREDKGPNHGRDERIRRSRSRSRDRRRDRDGERRKDRSRSRERNGGRLANGNHSPPRERDGRRRREGERRDRDRSVSRDRHRSRRDDPPPPRRPGRHRSRSRSPARDPKTIVRTRSPPRSPSSKPPPSGPSKQSRTSPSPPPTKAPPKGPKSADPLPKTNGAAPSNAKAAAPPSSSKMDIDEDSDPETAQMRRMMGFADFKTTKNTKVPGNDIYAVRKEKKTEYRQYMNRVGGFNRPLSPSR
ncbi:MAG: hypothetical protein Q9221_006633 [Calogaya cf. arnoldii]